MNKEERYIKLIVPYTPCSSNVMLLFFSNETKMPTPKQQAATSPVDQLEFDLLLFRGLPRIATLLLARHVIERVDVIALQLLPLLAIDYGDATEHLAFTLSALLYLIPNRALAN